MRLFIAVEIPGNIKDYICQIQDKIRSSSAKVRCVNTDSMHLTLKFLGEVQPNKLDLVNNELIKIKFKPFSCSLDSIGVFPDENYIRVVWVGLSPENNIIELQKNIDECLKNLFKKEKNYKPHITLARVKFIDDKKRFIDELKKIQVEDGEIDINNFKLIKSTLEQTGPVYENLHTYF